MLKVKLIDNTEYYKARKWTFILFFLASGCLGIVSNIMVEPGMVWMIAFVLLVVLLGMQMYWNQKLKNSKGEKFMTWDDNYLMVKEEGQIIHQFSTTSIQHIGLPADPGIPMESIKDMINEVSDQPKINYLEIKTKEEEHRFEFDLDSYYMIVQLEKCLTSWEEMSGKERRIIA